MDNYAITPFLRTKYAQALESAEYRVVKRIKLYGFPEPLREILEAIFEDFVCIACTGYPRNLLAADNDVLREFSCSQFTRDAFLKVKALCIADTPSELEATALRTFKDVMLPAICVPTEGYPDSIIAPDALDSVLEFHKRRQRTELPPKLAELLPNVARRFREGEEVAR